MNKTDKSRKTDADKFLKNGKNIFKRLIFSFLILLAFSLSAFSSVEDSQIILDGRKEPAKLKIGVTKVKTKDFPMNIDAKNKRIYAEIDVDDNNLVFVSEELAEIPSLSSTNGRRIVNNIEKYLTREIKKDPKFEYKVKKDEETGKKYLVVDCKTKLTGVYIYVVEKGTYKVKDVYKGVFNIPSTLVEDDIEYGTIHFTKDHDFHDNSTRVTSNSSGSNVMDQSENKEISWASMEGKFPFGYTPGNPSDYSSGVGNRYPRYKIVLSQRNGSQYAETEIGKFDADTGAFNYGTSFAKELPLQDIYGNNVSHIEINSSGAKKPLTVIFWSFVDKYPEVDTKVEIFYGTQKLGNWDWTPLRKDTFYIKIDKKGIAEGTTGKLTINNLHKLNLRGEQNDIALSYDGGNKIKVSGVQADYSEVSGDFPRKNYFKKNVDWFYNNPKVRVIIGNNSDTVNLNIDEQSSEGTFETAPITVKDKNKNVEIGKIKISAVKNSPYIQMELIDWKPFAGSVDEEVKIEYLGFGSKQRNNRDAGNEIIKTDILKLFISERAETGIKNTKGTLLIYNPGWLNYSVISSTNGKDLINNSTHVNGSQFNPDTQATLTGDFPARLISNNPMTDDDLVINWGDNPVVVVKNTSGSYQEEFELKKHKYTGIFSIDDWIPLISFENNEEVAEMYTEFIDYLGEKSKYLQLGFRGYNEVDFKPVDTSLTFEYYKNKGDTEPIKKDTLRIVIRRELVPEKANVTLSSPMVMQYSSDKFYRISHISKEGASTLDRDRESDYKKNTKIDDNQWIEADGALKDYDWQRLGKHKINMEYDGNNYGDTTTSSKGGTPNQTIVNFSNGTDLSFFYEGGNPYLSMGVRKWDFEETSGTLTITHYKEAEGLIQEEKVKYEIKIEKFDGLPYVDKTLDINYTKDFKKEYSFDDGKNPDGLEMNLGTIGLKGLDRRITYQSGGNGVEIRINGDKIGSGKVILQSEDYKDLKINGEIYFKNGGSEYYSIKSENSESEEQIKTDLWLKVPNGEYEKLAVGGRFKILKPDGSGSPVEVGVVVNSNSTKYFKPITDLYLEPEERYIQTKIEFQNEKTIIPKSSSDNDKGWIKLNQNDFPHGEIQGYKDETDGIWGKIDYNDSSSTTDISTDENLIIELYDNSGRLLAKSSKGGALDPTPIEIGNAEMLFRHKAGTNYIEFGVPEGKYVAGSTGKFYTKNILVENINGKEVEKLLFIRKFDVTFKSSGGYFAETKIILKNPMMTTDNEMENSEQMVFFRSSTSSSESAKIDVAGYGNHETSKDKIDWWEVSGVVSYPETLKDVYISAKHLTSAMVNFSNGKYIMEYPDGTKLKIKMEEIGGAYSLGIGYVDGPITGTSNKKDFELKWYNNKSGPSGTYEAYRIDKITVEIEEFDPRYYGTIYPEGMDGRGGYGKVGEGREYRKDENVLEDTVLIDLGTEYRNFMRYPGYVEKLGKKEDFEIRPVDEEVDILPDGNTNGAIKGKLRFIKNNNYLEKINNIKIFENVESGQTADYTAYKIMVEISKEDYLNLAVGKKYNIYSSQNNSEHKVLQIGFKGKSEPLLKKLQMNEPLNFTILPSPFKIEADILDFGVINLRSYPDDADKKAEIYANTQIKVTGFNSGDFELDMEGGNDTTKIYRQATKEQTAENDSLNVKDLKVAEEGKNIRPDGTIKKGYILYGTLEIPLDGTVKTGKYTGTTTVTATLISE